MSRGWIYQCLNIEDYMTRDKVFSGQVYTRPEDFLAELLDKKMQIEMDIMDMGDMDPKVDMPTVEQLIRMKVGDVSYAVCDKKCHTVLSYACVQIN